MPHHLIYNAEVRALVRKRLIDGLQLLLHLLDLHFQLLVGRRILEDSVDVGKETLSRFIFCWGHLFQATRRRRGG